MNNQFKKTALVTALLLELTAGAHAATINVDNTTCTLADAITAANTDTATGGCIAGDPGNDIIELPPNSEIVLSEQLPVIESDITLNANGSTIRRDQNSPTFSVLYLGGYSGEKLIINDAIITGGERSSLFSNWGSGIDAAFGVLIINHSEIIGNTGSGVSSYGADITINNSVISNNQGYPTARTGASGVNVFAGNLELNKSSLINNKTYGNAEGGGLSLNSTSTATINNSIISGNSTESVGGGISIDYGSTATINNSTISINSAESSGGAIHIGLNSDYYGITTNSAELNQVTITNNSTLENGGAIYNSEGGDVTITQSLITGNLAGNAVDEIVNAGTFTSNGYNLIGLGGYSNSIFISLDPSDAVIAESQITDVLNPVLTDNGGLTPTHAIPFTSPAVDFIPTAECHSLTDQTGKIRPSGNGCDVGAFEFDDTIFKDGFD